MNITDNPGFKWAMIAVCSVVGILILVGVIFLLVRLTKQRSAAKVSPGTEDAGKKDVEHGQPAPLQNPAAATGAAPAAPVAGAAHNPYAADPSSAVPPWEMYGMPPPGIMLAPVVPRSFVPFVSNPRPPAAPPYERLVLISSRVHEPLKVAEAVLPNVAAIVYDWKNFTLQELLRYIKKVLGNQKVMSIAVVAPGNKPGCVGLLEGATTTSEKIAQKGELAQFWRVLAGSVATNGVNDGRRIDLLGCRVIEAPREGAALLKELWKLTAVPFAAADDALGGYMLSTFMEEPATGQLSIISSTIRGLDIYFDRYSLLGIEAPTPGQPEQQPQPAAATATAPAATATAPMAPAAAYAPPLPPGAAPNSALAGPPPPTAPPVSAVSAAAGVPAAAAAPVAAAPAAPPAPVVPKDIFTRFSEAVAAQGISLPDVFKKYDVDRSGYLGVDEVVKMVREVLPGTSDLDSAHFRAMLDVDGNSQVTLAEFMSALNENKKVAAAVRTGRDDSALMSTLHAYLTDNDAVIRNFFIEADVNKSGTLDHAEVSALVCQIPGLVPDEQKFIINYLYQQDTTGTGQLTFDQLTTAVKAFGTPAAQAKVMAPAPAPAAAPAAQAPQQQLQQQQQVAQQQPAVQQQPAAGLQQPTAPAAAAAPAPQQPAAAAPRPPPASTAPQQPAAVAQQPQQPQQQVAPAAAQQPAAVAQQPQQQATASALPPAPGATPAAASIAQQPLAPLGLPAQQQQPMAASPFAPASALPPAGIAPGGSYGMLGQPALAPAQNTSRLGQLAPLAPLGPGAQPMK